MYLTILSIFTSLEGHLSGQKLYLNDIIFGLIFGIFSYLVVKKIADTYYKNTIFYKYLMTFYKVKILSTIFFYLIFAFYYKGGDTFAYLHNTLQLRKILSNDFSAAMAIIFDPHSFKALYNMKGMMIEDGLYMLDDSTHVIITFGFFVGFLCFNSYFVFCLSCSMVAMYGCWKLFQTFVELYPHLHKELAISCLFIPSVCFWGSGFLKDPLCIGALGVFTNSLYYIAFKNKKVFINIILSIISVYLIFKIKVYIVLAYAPAALIWIISRNKDRIKSSFLRAIFAPLLLILGLLMGLVSLQLMATFADKYSFENMMRTAQDTQNWLVYSSQTAGSTSFYTLGNIEYTPLGLLKVFPAAVNVSLFRPYIWEAKKPILMISSVESIITMGFTIFLLYKSGIWNTIKQILLNPDVLFCMVFSIIFAFAVGFTSFNFGALARYKIPFMPFYYIALFILADTSKKSKPASLPPKKR